MLDATDDLTLCAAAVPSPGGPATATRKPRQKQRVPLAELVAQYKIASADCKTILDRTSNNRASHPAMDIAYSAAAEFENKLAEAIASARAGDLDEAVTQLAYLADPSSCCLDDLANNDHVWRVMQSVGAVLAKATGRKNPFAMSLEKARAIR